MHPATKTQLAETCAAIAIESRRTDIECRRAVAERYLEHERRSLELFLPADLLADAVAYPHDPSVTWRVIRHLCWCKRDIDRGDNPYPLYTQHGTLRVLITCELHLWARQRQERQAWEKFRQHEREARQYRAQALEAAE